MARKRTHSESSHTLSPSSDTQLGSRKLRRPSSSPQMSQTTRSPQSSLESGNLRSQSTLATEQTLLDINMIGLNMDSVRGQDNGASNPITIYDFDSIEVIDVIHTGSGSSFSSSQDIQSQSPKAEPTGLGSLPANLIRQIFGYVLVQTTQIRPEFKSGMLLYGIHSQNEGDKGVSTAPNIDASLLQLNKKYSSISREVLYGQTYFQFNNAEVCHWWCKQIGERNLAQVQHMALYMDCGWYNVRSDPQAKSPFTIHDSYFDETWYKVLCRVQKTASLHTLILTLNDWGTLGLPEEMNELRKWRTMLVDKLSRFRELKYVKIKQTGSQWLEDREILQIEMLAMQSKSTLPGRFPRPRLGLAELIRQIRINRQHRDFIRRRRHRLPC